MQSDAASPAPDFPSEGSGSNDATTKKNQVGRCVISVKLGFEKEIYRAKDKAEYPRDRIGEAVDSSEGSIAKHPTDLLERLAHKTSRKRNLLSAVITH